MAQTPSTHRDVITVVRDPRHQLGKAIDTNGKKSSQVYLSLGIAKQHHVPNAEALAKLLKEIGDDSSAAIINSGFPDIPLGEEFLVMSEKVLRSKLNLAEDAPKPLGVHTVQHQGKNWKVVGRFKENVCASSWQLLDRDVDEHTPNEFSQLNHDEWLAKLESILPGLEAASRVSVPSSSARILCNRKPVSKQNRHTWVQLADPNDVDRMRGVIKARCIEQGLYWKKPRMQRSDPSITVGWGCGLPLDETVWTLGRLVFCGKPVVPAVGYTVRSLQPSISKGGRLDTRSITAPDIGKLNQICAATTGHLQWSPNANGGLIVTAHDLSLSTELELQDGTITSVEAALAVVKTDTKLRCQTPFRDSQSVAAFLSRGRDGKPFVHDSGTNTTHWLCDEDSISQGYKPSHARAATLQEVCDSLAPLPLDHLDQIYPEKVANLADEDQERFFAWLKQKNPSVTKALFNKAITGAKLRIRSISVDKAAGARHKIMVREEDVTAMADEAEEVVLKKSPEGTLVLYGGLLARVQEAPPYGMHGIGGNTRTPPPQMVLRTLNQVDILSVLEQYVVFQKTILSGPKNVAVPGPVLDTLLRGARHKAPLVRGLVNHPLVLDGDRVINAPGLNPRSGLFYVGPAWSDLKPYSPHEAAKALSRISNMLFAEFQFKTTLDRDVALAMLFTAIQRRVLPIAPGFALLAHIQSSGKTTLARVIHLVTTGREMPVVSFPEGDETEAEKRVTSILMNAPSMVVLDNLTDGITFQSSTLARAITSPTIRGRILGESREIEAPTNTLWVLTGNNISLGADEATRWLPVWLDAQMVRPHQRQFKNTDLYSYILSVREQIIRDVIGIVWGYLKESRRQMSKTRFADWDLMVRQSLMWAGAHDVQDAVDHALAQSGTAQAEAAALTCLDEQFQNKPFFASDIIGQMPPPNVPPPEWASHLIEALGRLRCRDPRSPTSLGRALRALAGRPVETSRGILTLKASTKDGKTSYRVEQNAASL